MKTLGFFDDNTLFNGGAAASRYALPDRVLESGEREISAFSEFSNLAGPHPGRWVQDRVIDGVLAVIYVAGCAAVVWAGSALR